MRNLRRFGITVGVVIGTVLGSAFGQIPSAAIRGSVADSSSAVVPGADLVTQYNDKVEARTRRVTNLDNTVTVIRPRTPFNQVINPITLPEQFSSGDSFLTQDVRLTRRVHIGETIRLSLIGEVFNDFNIANLSGYSNVLNQVNYGQPSTRAGQVFGSGGPRAFQVATRLLF